MQKDMQKNSVPTRNFSSAEVIEQLQHDVGELKQDCHKEQVHVHVHGDASKEPPHDDTNAVNVNLNLHLDDKPHHDEGTCTPIITNVNIGKDFKMSGYTGYTSAQKEITSQMD